MFKVIALLKRRADLSHEAFVDYYETRHSKLIMKCFPWTLSYRRNYIDFAGMIIGPAAAAPDFDVITEMEFADRSGYDRLMSEYEKLEISQQIADDEENFLDRSRTRFFVVEQRP